MNCHSFVQYLLAAVGLALFANNSVSANQCVFKHLGAAHPLDDVKLLDVNELAWNPANLPDGVKHKHVGGGLNLFTLDHQVLGNSVAFNTRSATHLLPHAVKSVFWFVAGDFEWVHFSDKDALANELVALFHLQHEAGLPRAVGHAVVEALGFVHDCPFKHLAAAHPLDDLKVFDVKELLWNPANLPAGFKHKHFGGGLHALGLDHQVLGNSLVLVTHAGVHAVPHAVKSVFWHQVGDAEWVHFSDKDAFANEFAALFHLQHEAGLPHQVGRAVLGALGLDHKCVFKHFADAHHNHSALLNLHDLALNAANLPDGVKHHNLGSGFHFFGFDHEVLGQSLLVEHAAAFQLLPHHFKGALWHQVGDAEWVHFTDKDALVHNNLEFLEQHLQLHHVLPKAH